MEVMMKCGHISNAICNDKPCCVICECFEVEDSKPNLEGRIAKCAECDNTTQSNYNLPFFRYREDKDTDQYYCGCHGWD